MAKILVIDDADDSRQYLVRLLGYGGHDLFQACDGWEGLLVTRAERPAVVICDLAMRVMDGFEYVCHLRADPALRDTIVFWTTAADELREVQARAEQCGVFGFLAKPARPADVLRAVGSALESLAAPGGGQAAHGSPVEAS